MSNKEGRVGRVRRVQRVEDIRMKWVPEALDDGFRA
jgi:hypothetical protein